MNGKGPALRASDAPGRQFLTVQALRFIAALAVVVLHSTFYTSERLNDGLGIYALGANGVRIFFVISGFVMVMASDDPISRRPGWLEFATKRVVRIVPMYWIATTVKLAALLVVPTAVLHAELDWAYIAKSYFFLPALNVDGQVHPLLGVGWTLIFEMFFYALFTISLLTRAAPVRFVGPILVLLAAASLLRTTHWPIAAHFFADPIVLDFLAGMLIARWVQGGGRLPGFWGSVAIAAGASYLFLPIPRPSYGTLEASLLTTCAAALVVSGAVALEGRIGHVLPRPVLFLGAASYSIYLVHPLTSPVAPALLAMSGIIWPASAILLAVAIALLCGSVAHLWVEKPAIRWLSALLGRLGLLRSGQLQGMLPPASRAERRD